MNAQSVVFAQGEYRYENNYGSARVIVPRNIRLNEISKAFIELFEGRDDAPKTE